MGAAGPASLRIDLDYRLKRLHLSGSAAPVLTTRIQLVPKCYVRVALKYLGCTFLRKYIRPLLLLLVLSQQHEMKLLVKYWTLNVIH